MKISIIGAGKIGVALLCLMERSPFIDSVTMADLRELVTLGDFSKAKFRHMDAKDPAQLEALIKDSDAVISAGPFYINKTIAAACAKWNCSYFDFTEDTETTQFIVELAKTSKATFAPQCGLAPGAINIIGSGLAHTFKSVRSVELRVGALPLSTTNQMKYYVSWSAAGLLNTYCRPAEVLVQGQRMQAAPLDGVESLMIDGVEYEAFNTSGGVATMCQTYEGKISELNYKTLRYPGHRDLMKFLLTDLNLSQKPDLLNQIFADVPITFNDVIVFCVNALGMEDSKLIQRNYIKKIYAEKIGNHLLSAIQLSTAAGLMGVLELFVNGCLPQGFIKQESITMEQFLNTQWGSKVYRTETAIA